MLNRLGLRLADLAVQQSRDRINRTDNLAKESRNLSQLSKVAIEASRELMNTQIVRSLATDADTVSADNRHYLLGNWSDAEVEAFADALLDVYVIADERRDAEMKKMAEQALLSIGRHFASKLGPKLAGVTIN